MDQLPELIIEKATWEQWWKLAIRDKARYIICFNMNGAPYPLFASTKDQAREIMQVWSERERCEVWAVHDVHGHQVPQMATPRYMAIID